MFRRSSRSKSQFIEGDGFVSQGYLDVEDEPVQQEPTNVIRNLIHEENVQGEKKNRGSFIFNKLKRQSVKRRRKKYDKLTSKQVTMLSDMEPYQIAKAHTFAELELIVKLLTDIYDGIIQSRRQRESQIQMLVAPPVVEEPTRSKRKSVRRRTSRNTLLPKFGKAKQEKPEVSPPLAKDFSLYEVEKALEKTDRAIRTHQTYKEKEKQRWRVWEDKEREENLKALNTIMAIVPKDLKGHDLSSLPVLLDGNVFLARRLIRHKVFLLFTMSDKDLRSIHPVDLTNRYHIGGLDLIELRALYALSKGMLKDWRIKLRNKLKAQLDKLNKNELTPKEIRHPAYDNKPDFTSERKQSVVNFLSNRSSVVPSKAETTRRPSILADDVKRRTRVFRNLVGPDGAPLQAEKDSPAKEINDIYLGKTKSNSINNEEKRNSKQHRQVEKYSSDSDAPKRRPKDNIFDHFQKQSQGQDRESKRNKSFMDEEVEDIAYSQDLEQYFEKKSKKREENVASEHERKAGSYSSKRDPPDLNFDEENLQITENDNEETLKRKQSQLFVKAFEMINSDEVGDDDEVFLRTLRSLSAFSETLTDNSRLEVEEESDEDDFASNFYLNPSSRRASSIAESAYTEAEHRR